MSETLRQKAATYLRHLEMGEFSNARAMCTETATVWHNNGTGDQTIDENVAHMERLVGAIPSMHYDIVRQFSDDNAVLQQHVLEVTTGDGMRGQVLAAVYFRFDGDLISRIEEYANFVPHPDEGDPQG